MKVLPKTDFPRFFRTAAKISPGWMNQIQSLIAFVDTSRLKDLDQWPQGALIRSTLKAQQVKAGGHALLVLPGPHPLPVCVALMPESGDPYAVLTIAARLVKNIAPYRATAIGVATVVEDSRTNVATNALLSALLAATERQPTAKSRPSAHWQPQIVRVSGGAPERAVSQHSGAHLARWLTQLPPNVLTPGSNRKAAVDLARTHGWLVETYDERRLRGLGAGAFLAVTAGSARRDASILRVQYRPRKKSTRAPIALVGKGLCFDTGGHNLKPAGSMLNMHADMAGSAVVLGTLLALCEAGYPHPVDAWLALAENRIGPEAYTQQDVVTSLNGTTIQIVHTDAEGRMVLADTLALAARTRPAAIIDFATLTGACVSALTERMSGFFTNRPELRDVVESAGTAAGERMHGFPMPDDFDDDLDAPSADILQCLIGGKGDHIYAARFLSRFVPADIPWVHCDLSSAERTGGLAHVPHTITGFGVRFAQALLESTAFQQTITD